MYQRRQSGSPSLTGSNNNNDCGSSCCTIDGGECSSSSRSSSSSPCRRHRNMTLSPLPSIEESRDRDIEASGENINSNNYCCHHNNNYNSNNNNTNTFNKHKRGVATFYVGVVSAARFLVFVRVDVYRYFLYAFSPLVLTDP
jgi:hypothetical protein